MSLNTKEIVIVTGASNGIGKAIAINLMGNQLDDNDNHYQNQHLIAIGRNEKRLAQLKAHISKPMTILAHDQSNYESMQRRLSHTLSTVSALYKPYIKTLVCCAGICNNVGEFNKLDFAKIAYEIQTNITGTLATIQTALKYMDSNSQIVIVSSPIGKVPLAKYGVYGATKAALINFSESLNQELEMPVCCVLPTLTNTEMAQHRPFQLVYPLEVSYVSKEIIKLIEKRADGLKSIGLQAMAAMAAQRLSPFPITKFM